LDTAKADFVSEQVSDIEILATIRNIYRWPNTGRPGPKGYILDLYSAVSMTAVLQSAKTVPGIYNIALSTVYLAKFSYTVKMVLAEKKEFQFKDILPLQFIGLESLPRQVIYV
jgi:threonine synthase